jgi:WhiB family redox-sensing transcriptional regulator
MSRAASLSTTTGRHAEVIGDLGRLLSPEPWVDQALCAQVDVGDLFFPSKGGSTAPAVQVCKRCPVQEQCLQYALARREPHGIWGGRSERERRRMRQGLSPRKLRSHCGKGHEYAVVGRTSQGACRECRRVWDKGYQERVAEKYKRRTA